MKATLPTSWTNEETATATTGRCRSLAAFLLGLVLAAAAALAAPAAALAAPPANDDFANAAAVAALPFSDSVDLAEATMEPGEQPFCGATQTVWYAFTATDDVVLRATSSGSSFFSTNLVVYRADGSGLGGLSWVTCGQFGQPAVFTVQTGKTYYIQAGSVFGGGGTLALQLDTVPAPANDNFANAIAVSGPLPFTDDRDITGGTIEAGEPVNSCAGTFTRSIWYAFTPASTGSFSTAGNTFGNLAVNVYTGGSLASLTSVACGGSGGLGTWHAVAGTTYYLQLGTFGSLGQVQIRVIETPPPAVGFGFGPGDPSVFDIVQFFDTSFDPANVGIQTRQWDFGDGSSATGLFGQHRYSADGDYTAKLTATTFDGRSASATTVVRVRTHDVAVVKLLAPKSSRAGRTEQLNVWVSNGRYHETVQVQLYRSSPNGFEQVASLTQSVPVLRGQTTSFRLNYTFTSDDAAIGKVTFKAVASLVGSRDALPADNETIAAPTNVSP
jgi:PKD domain